MADALWARHTTWRGRLQDEPKESLCRRLAAHYCFVYPSINHTYLAIKITMVDLTSLLFLAIKTIRAYSLISKHWRGFPVRTTPSREFVCVFCFASCKTLQNVNILQLLFLWFCNYLHEVNSRFQNNRHYGCKQVEALCFILLHITWWNNLKGLKDKVCSS